MNELQRMKSWRARALALLLALGPPILVHAQATVAAEEPSAPVALQPASRKTSVPVGVAYAVTGRYDVNVPMLIELTLTPLEAMTGMRIEIPESEHFDVDVDQAQLAFQHPVASRVYRTVLQVTPRGPGTLFRFLVVARRTDAQFASVFTVDLRRPRAKPANAPAPKARARRE